MNLPQGSRLLRSCALCALAAACALALFVALHGVGYAQETGVFGSITGTVYHDGNGNGVRNLGEPGIAGVTIGLRNEQGVVISTTTTSAAGEYQFLGLLTPQSYSVLESDPAGYASTTPNTVTVALPLNAGRQADFGDQRQVLVFLPALARDAVAGR